MNTEVLVVGAGPTGLVLALWLTRLGVPSASSTRTAEPGTTSRALVVHARTLELYRQLGLADEVVARGLKFAAVNLWVRGRHVARIAARRTRRGPQPLSRSCSSSRRTSTSASSSSTSRARASTSSARPS